MTEFLTARTYFPSTGLHYRRWKIVEGVRAHLDEVMRWLIENHPGTRLVEPCQGYDEQLGLGWCEWTIHDERIALMMTMKWAP
jgi:hypothetical protein